MRKFLISIFISAFLIILGYAFCRVYDASNYHFLYVGYFVGALWQFIRNNIID